MAPATAQEMLAQKAVLDSIAKSVGGFIDLFEHHFGDANAQPMRHKVEKIMSDASAAESSIQMTTQTVKRVSSDVKAIKRKADGEWQQVAPQPKVRTRGG
jgi:hypothetical protein